MPPPCLDYLEDLCHQAILDCLPIDPGILVDPLERVDTGSGKKRLELVQAPQTTDMG